MPKHYKTTGAALSKMVKSQTAKKKRVPSDYEIRATSRSQGGLQKHPAISKAVHAGRTVLRHPTARKILAEGKAKDTRASRTTKGRRKKR